MAKPDDSSVRFPCPRCFTRLKASLAQAGTKRRCPRCQRVFEVPATSRGLTAHEGYAVNKGMDRSPAADPRYIAVGCPVCSTRMYATEDQVGRELVCPDCDTVVLVPPPAEAEKEKIRRGSSGVEVEEYALCDDVAADALPSGSRPADPRYIPVTCPVCDTLMKVAEDQIGQQIVCPDCRVPTIVAPPAETPARERGPAILAIGEVGEYAIRDEDRPTAGSPAAHPSYVAVVCPLCNTRLHALQEQVGQEIVCPDCNTTMVVPPPAETPPKRKGPGDIAAGGAEEYALREAVNRSGAGCRAAEAS